MIQDLEWRYATKAMNGEKIDDQQRIKILEAMRLAPTSLGLQPLKFYLIKDQESLDKLSPAAFNQPQISKADSAIVIASKKSMDDQWLDEVTELYREQRELDDQQVEEMKSRLQNYLAPMSPEQFSDWTSKQAYIALGFGLAAAANQRVDSTPMEGFQSEEVDKLLGLDSSDYKSNLIMVLGKRDAEKDFLVNQKKVRYPFENIVEEIKL